jgi:DNA-binding beta-propeller fold protein YncE
MQVHTMNAMFLSARVLKRHATCVLPALAVAAGAALAQPPRDPALLIPQEAPLLDYVPVPDPLSLPDGVEMGASTDVDFDSRGHLYVLTRGSAPVMEFDADGRFVRAFGEGIFSRTHGLYIDADDNIWVTDVREQIVVKFSAAGEMLMTLGTRGEAGAWDEAAGTRRFSEPNDLVVADNGDVFVVQGHMPGERGDARVLKFAADGSFIRDWGGKGSEPGRFQVAHGIALDADGLLWVMDRENSRIEVFDQDGKFVREMAYAGLPCGVDIGDEFVFMVNGFTGQILQMDLAGNVLAAMGRPGTNPGEFGEAHYIAVSPRGELYVSDTVNRAVQKFVPRRN